MMKKINKNNLEINLEIEHSVINKPWGSYQVLYKTSNYLVKKITINSGHRISLQYHKNREEYWTVVEGTGLGTVGNLSCRLCPGATLYVPKEIIHRIEAQEDMEIIEVQMGMCDENDIVRLEDDYKREHN